MLASGCNDNGLKIWKDFSTVPMISLSGHSSAVKSLAWSPRNSAIYRKYCNESGNDTGGGMGILASGGGTADKKLKLWNVNTGDCIGQIDTGSQVNEKIFPFQLFLI